MNNDLRTLLVFGGSQGSQFLNQKIKIALENDKLDFINVVWIVGKNNYESLKHLNRKNVIIILMSIELILLAVNFVSFSYFLGDLTGQIFSLFVLTVAAAEAAIGLAILVCFFRNKGSIAVDDANVMKG